MFLVEFKLKCQATLGRKLEIWQSESTLRLLNRVLKASVNGIPACVDGKRECSNLDIAAFFLSLYFTSHHSQMFYGRCATQAGRS